ncbi:Protein tyrosine phosphatase (modular protein) [uncultured Mycobacterium sp.]|uniref:Protein tyrosine phosphatase (Modular protein) n=1 Tax=uncultured Mycobacterium sp. TaxID=171292 RepID=A0A1Y5PEV0_9MYCO|nr:Protein tyrosine phosphatase (modular protein) [uncultured Mycobacterium sp.]
MASATDALVAQGKAAESRDGKLPVDGVFSMRWRRSPCWLGVPRLEIHTWELALHLLFVCTGNICRSPTAERLADTFAAGLGIPDFKTSSAGTRAVINHPIHTDAAVVLEKLGGSAADFSARQLTPRIASDADLVLTMTRAHRNAVLERAPRQLHRTFTLLEAAHLVAQFDPQNLADLAALRGHVPAREVLDISDPIGQQSQVFVAVGSQIADLLPPVLELCRRSSV